MHAITQMHPTIFWSFHIFCPNFPIVESVIAENKDSRSVDGVKNQWSRSVLGRMTNWPPRNTAWAFILCESFFILPFWNLKIGYLYNNEIISDARKNFVNWRIYFCQSMFNKNILKSIFKKQTTVFLLFFYVLNSKCSKAC